MGSAVKVAPIFSEETLVQRYLVHFLWIMPLAFCVRGFSHNANAAMNAINHPYHAAINIIIRLMVLTLPLAGAGVWAFGFIGLLVGILLGEIISAFVAIRWIDHLYKLHQRRYEDDNSIFETSGIKIWIN